MHFGYDLPNAQQTLLPIFFTEQGCLAAVYLNDFHSAKYPFASLAFPDSVSYFYNLDWILHLERICRF